MQIRQKGFVFIESLLGILILAAIGFTSYYFWHHHSQTIKNQQSFTLNAVTADVEQAIPKEIASLRADTSCTGHQNIATRKVVAYSVPGYYFRPVVNDDSSMCFTSSSDVTQVQADSFAQAMAKQLSKYGFSVNKNPPVNLVLNNKDPHYQYSHLYTGYYVRSGTVCLLGSNSGPSSSGMDILVLDCAATKSLTAAAEQINPFAELYLDSKKSSLSSGEIADFHPVLSEPTVHKSYGGNLKDYGSQNFHYAYISIGVPQLPTDIGWFYTDSSGSNWRYAGISGKFYCVSSDSRWAFSMLPTGECPPLSRA